MALLSLYVDCVVVLCPSTRLPLLTNREVLQLRMEAARYFSWTYSDFIGGFGDILRMTANAVRRLAASVNDQPAREDCLTLDLL